MKTLAFAAALAVTALAAPALAQAPAAAPAAAPAGKISVETGPTKAVSRSEATTDQAVPPPA